MRDERAFANDADLGEPLLTAVRAVRAEPISDDVLDRVEQRLSALTPRATSQANPPRSKAGRFLAIAASVAVMVGIVFVTFPYANRESSALAQLRVQLEKLRTVTFDRSIQIEGQPTVNSRQMARSGGEGRAEYSDGTYCVTKQSKATYARMKVDPEKKTIRMIYGFPQDEMQDVIHFIRSVAKTEDARPIGAREFDGRLCPGFVVRQQPSRERQSKRVAQELRVWTDPKTQLPVYMENVAQRASGKPKMAATFSNFKYDVPLDDSLFSLTPPEGYAVTTVGTPPERRSGPWDSEKLLVTVGEGIGLAKFGMSKEEVAKLLGKPEEVREVNIGQRWKYNSQGVSLLFRSESEGRPGLYLVLCDTSNGGSSRTFAGQTREGIRIGSSIDEVRRAYGQPKLENVKDGLGFMFYSKQGLNVSLQNGEVLRFTVKEPAR